MSEIVTKQKMQEILSPRNKNEAQKRQFVKDMRDRKVDVRKRDG